MPHQTRGSEQENNNRHQIGYCPTWVCHKLRHIGARDLKCLRTKLVQKLGRELNMWLLHDAWRCTRNESTESGGMLEGRRIKPQLNRATAGDQPLNHHCFGDTATSRLDVPNFPPGKQIVCKTSLGKPHYWTNDSRVLLRSIEPPSN